MEDPRGKSVSRFVICLVLGGLVGALIGEIVSQFITRGPLHTVLDTSISFGLNPELGVDLSFLSFSLGLVVNINLLTVAGILLGIVFYKRFLQAP